MRAVIADDDPISLALITRRLERWNYEVQAARDGEEAWRLLVGDPREALALINWNMPRLNGPELCRRIRRLSHQGDSLRTDARFVYIVLLTAARSDRENMLAGLTAGADDHLTKPFDPGELSARLEVGVRSLTLQRTLADRVRDLEEALANIKQLHGLLPMCCYCKSIRDDQNYWTQVEHYIAAHSAAQFSHGICPACYQNRVEPELQAHRERLRKVHTHRPA